MNNTASAPKSIRQLLNEANEMNEGLEKEMAEVTLRVGNMRAAATLFGKAVECIKAAADKLDAAEFNKEDGSPVRELPDINITTRTKLLTAVEMIHGHCESNANVAEAMIDARNRLVGIAPVPTLLPFQRRVVDERDEAQTRQNKLSDFLESIESATISPAERARLFQQEEILGDLIEILDERIAAFPQNPSGN